MRSRRRWPPFLALAPALVVVVGLFSAIGIGEIGLRQLRRLGESHASRDSELLVKMLAARLAAVRPEERAGLLERAALRSGAELLLVSDDAQPRIDVTRGVGVRQDIARYIARGAGDTKTALGRARFHAERLPRPFQKLWLIAFVAVPDTPFATSSLIRSMVALTFLLVGGAALVAFALARDVHADVRFVRQRIVAMARAKHQPAGQSIPVGSVDQVGLLTSAFNVLVDRFTAAERVYRQDLSGALAYDRDRSAFLAALSHELRTPLNAILGFTDVLLSEVDGPLVADAKEALTIIRNSGGHLRALIDDVLDLSALESGELRLNVVPIDLFEIAKDIVRELRITAEKKGLELVLAGLPSVAYVDEHRVRQIIGNVIGNAVKYTEVGKVAVNVYAVDDEVAVRVQDTGPGIAEEDHESIFQEYWQTNEARRRRVGTGLGLAITRRLVEMHGGRVELDSKLGRGSTFRIVLPHEPPTLRRDRSRPRPSRPPPEPAPA
ncbi:MAG TPA: HAMP domain-containing sensor histidine kinase [Polyangiaceae bacterium]|nr:HAMP domain-containing sensor histidine kinase [Polyangiaceae bacterium]